MACWVCVVRGREGWEGDVRCEVYGSGEVVGMGRDSIILLAFGGSGNDNDDAGRR